MENFAQEQCYSEENQLIGKDDKDTIYLLTQHIKQLNSTHSEEIKKQQKSIDNAKLVMSKILESNLTSNQIFQKMKLEYSKRLVAENTFRNDFLVQIDEILVSLKQETAILEEEDLTLDLEDSDNGLETRNDLEDAVFQLQKNLLNTEKSVTESDCPRIINSCRTFAVSEIERLNQRIKDLTSKLNGFYNNFQKLKQKLPKESSDFTSPK